MPKMQFTPHEQKPKAKPETKQAAEPAKKTGAGSKPKSVSQETTSEDDKS